ncbi:MAG TPA: hypothetical protein PKE30_05860 [Niabella sp.]|nr:hypothetical protein [Niabella sp.]
MLIRNKFKARHRILKELAKHYNDNYDPTGDQTDYLISFNTLRDKMPFNEVDFEKNLHFLIFEKEVETTGNPYDEIDWISTYYFISVKGLASFYDKKYISLGKGQLLTGVYDVIKILSAIVLLLIAIITFIRNMIITDKNQKEIQSLKNEIILLKKQNS